MGRRGMVECEKVVVSEAWMVVVLIIIACG